jgi:hypothetical protein
MGELGIYENVLAPNTFKKIIKKLLKVSPSMGALIKKVLSKHQHDLGLIKAFGESSSISEPQETGVKGEFLRLVAIVTDKIDELVAKYERGSKDRSNSK